MALSVCTSQGSVGMIEQQAMRSTKNPLSLLIELLTVLASYAYCQEGQTNGSHLRPAAVPAWYSATTTRYLISREQVFLGGPGTFLPTSSASTTDHAWQCPVPDSAPSLPALAPLIFGCPSRTSSHSRKFISSCRHPGDFSGHGRAAAMRSTKNLFSLLIQVGNFHSCCSKKIK